MIRTLALMLLLSPGLFAQQVEYKSYTSKVLSRDLKYGVYLPPSYATSPGKKYPVLYFLHGLFEDETRWSTRGGTDQIMNRMIAEGKIGEFIVAIPYGGTSFYTNTRDGSEKWEDAFVTEFIPLIESTYRVNATRMTRGISGTSMGGYGALKIAMKHPDMFGSASAHSAVLLEDLSAAKVSAGRLARFQSLFNKIYGIDKDLTYWEANNPMTLAKDTKKLNGLRLYFDCGTEDDYGFDLGAKQLDEMLTKAGYPHEAHLYPGHHGWDYAMLHTNESILFHWKVFSGK
ncbi:MAG TPA: alpha/beta hydrolase family protein [Terriglobia bacterium]|jgi:S-formylglutathione hydrolase FrmB